MLVKQLSAFVENKPGKAAAATAALAQAGVNIRAMSIGDSTTFGVVRLIVDDLEKGSEALKNINITTSVNEVLAVHMDDKPGSLNKILE
ncbi:MAG: ACT domain-containing protein, partial [Clostridia bacterium]|nr:ACT domain-containing protein [Clostridia bacterium]